MKQVLPWVAVVVLSCFTVCADAQTIDMKALVAALQQGGYVIVFRHGATNRDQADMDPLHPDNIAQRRLLSEQGRDVARQLGEAFKTLGIPVGRVYTSQFHRAVETGKLLSRGAVHPTLDITEGGLVVTPMENDRRAAALKMMVGMMPEAGKNMLLVTHKPNLLDAFGKDWFEVKEGEASVFKPDGSGQAALMARVQADDRIKAASAH
jgi:broad specificity phosphatase PhoE